jgi:CRP/FNR family transcriptional regulator
MPQIFILYEQEKLKYQKNPCSFRGPIRYSARGISLVLYPVWPHARLDTAVALENVSLISVEKDMFGLLIQKNPAVAMKIIRFFSRKLRQFDSAITNLSLKTSGEEDPEHLFNIGEYYLKKRIFNHAIYAYQKYIQRCPSEQ